MIYDFRTYTLKPRSPGEAGYDWQWVLCYLRSVVPSVRKQGAVPRRCE